MGALSNLVCHVLLVVLNLLLDLTFYVYSSAKADGPTPSIIDAQRTAGDGLWKCSLRSFF
jgi:hypothetical protein